MGKQGILRVVLFLAFFFVSITCIPIAYSSETSVRIGILAHRGTDECLKMWSPTAEYLSANIPGHSFVIVPLDFNEINAAVNSGKVDFVLVNSSIYVELETLYGASRIATMKNLGPKGIHTTTFGGVIFCSADNKDIRSLKDLKHKSFMAVDETSLGGWRVALRELKAGEIDPYKDFSRLEFGGTHDAVVLAVRDGKADAGTVRTDTLERMHEEGKIDIKTFRVLNEQSRQYSFPFLLSSRLYPEWPFARVRSTSQDLAQEVAIVLLNMPADTPAAKAAKIAGWTIPLDYQPVHEIMKELRVGPYKNYGRVTIRQALRQYWLEISMFLAVLVLMAAGTVCLLQLNRRLYLSRSELQRTRDELEDRVKERTATIESVNEELLFEIRERKRLEEQLIHSQKMEAIGTLSAGIAHDFNNILTAIMGYSSLMSSAIKKDDPLAHHLKEIIKSAEKATNLVQGLLAFSRKQIIKPKPIDINTVIKDLEKMLSRIIGEDIELRTNLSDKGLTVLADYSQMEQVLMNFAANARDAMHGGGVLTIKTELSELNSETAQKLSIEKPGMYAILSITDTGTGIDEDTRKRIFDPYFTTKEMGRGTGLGLSIIYGIIQQHNGYITVQSDKGKGTTFMIYLPFIKATVEEKPEAVKDIVTAVSGGTGTILLSEDNESVRMLLTDTLEAGGYTVIAATDGEDAVTKFMGNKDAIQLLVLDVIMPKKNVKEVYAEIHKIKPGIKTLFMSGYTADIIHEKGIFDEEIDFICKPVLPGAFLKKIREILDR